MCSLVNLSYITSNFSSHDDNQRVLSVVTSSHCTVYILHLHAAGLLHPFYSTLRFILHAQGCLFIPHYSPDHPLHIATLVTTSTKPPSKPPFDNPVLPNLSLGFP